jgi:pimeloyl-ACP methyl ester carboxylesterase
MATFILIHGAWHGGWCWERVAPLLVAQGHRVLAPDLPGMGADRRKHGSDPVGDWTGFVADLATSAGGPVILIGHSLGGVVISEVAERVPDAIDRLVYLTAFLLESGQSLADVATRYPDVGPARAFRPAEVDGEVIVDPDQAVGIFYNEMSADDAREAVDRLGPQPLAAFTKPVTLSAERFGRVPRAYVEATDDRAISLEMQRDMQAVMPCDPVITLQCDHSPFYSAVPELAEALLSLARSTMMEAGSF